MSYFARYNQGYRSYSPRGHLSPRENQEMKLAQQVANLRNEFDSKDEYGNPEPDYQPITAGEVLEIAKKGAANKNWMDRKRRYNDLEGYVPHTTIESLNE